MSTPTATSSIPSTHHIGTNTQDDRINKDPNANIMLDLEYTAAAAHNPAILEIGAVWFDIDTGTELATFKSLVSLISCLGLGLVQTDVTVAWLANNIPDTLATSRTTKVSLEGRKDALAMEGLFSGLQRNLEIETLDPSMLKNLETLYTSKVLSLQRTQQLQAARDFGGANDRSSFDLEAKSPINAGAAPQQPIRLCQGW
ncbi:hypothetical protein BDZ45DRAFT_810720 [Acephala macrosclerotiorum]|nr:hypothetical protein BDZ45DRAFT_810720 [Acephala macrosclerotiorum]